MQCVIFILPFFIYPLICFVLQRERRRKANAERDREERELKKKEAELEKIKQRLAEKEKEEEIEKMRQQLKEKEEERRRKEEEKLVQVAAEKGSVVDGEKSDEGAKCEVKVDAEGEGDVSGNEDENVSTLDLEWSEA